MHCFIGDPTGAEKHAFHNLVWFDHLLRMFGPLFPFMVLATRFKLASLAPDILAFDRQPWLEQLIVYIGITATRTGIYYIHRLGKLTNSWCSYATLYTTQHHDAFHARICAFVARSRLLLRHPQEQACLEATADITAVALIVLCGVAGIFYYLARAGAVSALPAHLMSDHVFLGSSLVALLAAEAVLLARDIRSVAYSLPCI